MRTLGLALGFALCLAAALPALAAREPQPAQQIPLTPMGYQPMLPELLASGSSMMSVHFVDQAHLLVTFGVRALLKRDIADPPDDYDRMIGAFYLDLPSGKVLARAEWRLHDRGQYLWDLGQGRFVLRVRDQLTLVEPLHADRPENALQQVPFLHSERKIVAMEVSPEHDLLTVESADRNQIVLGDSGQSDPTTRAPVQINFYRLIENQGRLVASAAGAVRAPVPLSIPVNSSGYLDAIEGKHDHWVFQFNAPGGKTKELAAFDTSCAPHPMFVSRSEFIAFGCLGSSDRQAVAGFSLNGDFMWQQSFSDSYVAPNFEFAPEAGRFAIGRTMLASGASGAGELSPSAITGQEIRVYQTYNGKVLLRVTCAPAVKAGQNFALSPDGMKLAVLREAQVQHKATETTDAYVAREATVDVFDLPALSADDKTAVAEARQLPLPEAGSRFELAAHHPGEPAAETPAAAAQSDAVPAAAASSTPVPAAQVPQDAADSSTATQVGDVQPTGPRKPPTLYAPGEQPSAKGPEN